VITALQAALSWDLEAEVSYRAGETLECAISFTAPETGKYYLMGALYTSSSEYISGTLFGLLLPEGSEYAINSAQYTSLWELEADESRELPCRFTFNRSDVVLGIFLMRMAGDEPSLEDDEQVGSLSVQLSSPAPPVMVESLITMAMIVGVFGYMSYEALKD